MNIENTPKTVTLRAIKKGTTAKFADRSVVSLKNICAEAYALLP